uniref:Uncharacterized protein n=1 Tax=Avena sativa TaxID=4498 RepID=A0ACD5VYY3_AVESA
MASLARCLLVCLSLATLSLGCLPSRAAAMGLPRPPPNMNFTVGVEGYVWCKGCRYAGYNESKDASPLQNAAVLLRCSRENGTFSLWGTSDASGYFKIQTAKQVAPFTSRDCKVFVLGSPVRACRVDVSPRWNKGAPIKLRKFVPVSDVGLQALYKAGDFVFGPNTPGKC